jgi:hypothetical protein
LSGHATATSQPIPPHKLSRKNRLRCAERLHPAAERFSLLHSMILIDRNLRSWFQREFDICSVSATIGIYQSIFDLFGDTK